MRTRWSIAGFVILQAVGMVIGGARTIAAQADERPALPFPPGIDAESLCGDTDDLQDVELYDGLLGVSRDYVDTHQASTVQLQWMPQEQMADALPGHALGNVMGQRWCSGTLIGRDLVLTAGHCFDVQNGSTGWTSPFAIQGGKVSYVEPSELAKLQVVHFLYQIDGKSGGLRTAITFPVLELIEYRRQSLDYAIVRLGPNQAGKLPGEVFSATDVISREPVAAETIAVIQHPQGWPKKIEAGTVLKTVGSIAWYDDVDTFGGSSGSGVRDGLGSVIAVHTHGGCEFDGGNKGVTTSAIAAASDVF